MTWTQRTDVGPSERCLVGTDNHGQVFGYVQEFPDGSAAYWFARVGKAMATKTPEEARLLAAQRAFPLDVIAIDEHGTTHLSERYMAKDNTDQFVEAKTLASALLKNVRSRGGMGTFSNAALSLNVKHKIERVQIVANDGTTLFDQAV